MPIDDDDVPRSRYCNCGRCGLPPMPLDVAEGYRASLALDGASIMCDIDVLLKGGHSVFVAIPDCDERRLFHLATALELLLGDADAMTRYQGVRYSCTTSIVEGHGQGLAFRVKAE